MVHNKESLNSRIIINMKQNERESIEQLANFIGVSLSDYCRTFICLGYYPMIADFQGLDADYIRGQIKARVWSFIATKGNHPCINIMKEIQEILNYKKNLLIQLKGGK